MADLDPKRIHELKAAELQSPTEYNGAAEARVRRKLDWHLMPLFFVLYMLAFLDRSNIGNAVIAGMTRDLHLVGDRYEWLLTIFYITYVVFEFSLLFWKIFPPHRVAAVVVFCWGVIATLQSVVHNWSGLMALRFFLGAFEAAYAPGVIYLLSFFYLRHEVGFRCGMFASAAPLASTFAGALAYGITSGHSSLSNWRLLFLVEGLPTILLGPIAFFFIPDSPDNARFLNAEEKAIAKSRAVRQTGTSDRIGGVNLKQLAQTLYDAKAWCYALMYFSVNVSYASLPVYLPTILAKMGYSDINAQGLSAPPYFTAFLFANITTFIADRTQQRGLVLIITSLIGGIGYIVLATVTTVGVRYFAVYLAAAGVFSTIPNILAWTLSTSAKPLPPPNFPPSTFPTKAGRSALILKLLDNQGSDTRRGAGLVIINVIGQCGPILGTRLYPTAQGPRYVKGMSICAAFMFFAAVMALALRILLVWENRKLDQRYDNKAGERRERDQGAGVAVEDYGPKFRYVL